MTTPARKNPLPRWRGFNLLNFFVKKSDTRPVQDEFGWIADWGFDFVRLPTCYTLWTDPAKPFELDESVLARLDDAVNWADHHKLHCSLNLHRAPGYCVNDDGKEPFNLWTDQDALDAFCFQWESFARRYKGIDSEKLSFDLVNEPPAVGSRGMTRESHERVIRAAVDAIRKVDPTRLIVADGMGCGNVPIPELADTGIAQSCRGYLPMAVSHYKASWVGVPVEKFLPPDWPMTDHAGKAWDRAALETHYAQWTALIDEGIGVHCGECGCYQHTPHDVFLSWFEDVLDILKSNGIGWGLWNLRGSFGVMDSNREDVDYEDFNGHKLDRKLLDLLQKY